MIIIIIRQNREINKQNKEINKQNQQPMERLEKLENKPTLNCVESHTAPNSNKNASLYQIFEEYQIENETEVVKPIEIYNTKIKQGALLFDLGYNHIGKGHGKVAH